MLFTPPLSQTVTPSRTLSPSSVTYLMDGPYGLLAVVPLWQPIIMFWSGLKGRR